MPLIRWTGIESVSHIDGVFRYPGAVERVGARDAARYTERGLAVALSGSATLPPAARHAERTRRRTRFAEPDAPDFSRVPRELLFARGDMTGAVDCVIPCYRSERHLPLLLADLGDDDMNLILVVDGDGYDPVPDVLRHAPESLSVRVMRLAENTGFAHAVNTGATLGRAPYVLLLNADVRLPRADWLLPLVNACMPDDVGAAGGLQHYPDGTVGSCGSEYDYATESFEHVFKKNAPSVNDPYLREPGDRDVMTGACLLVKRSVWTTVGGLDEAYRIGYWEDTDLCMKIRHAGYRIRYTPGSIVTHAVGHSGASGHPHYDANKALFHHRWVETGLVERYARQRGRKSRSGEIVACYIVLNEEEYIAPSLESVYDIADRIVIVEGGVRAARELGLCREDGSSLDSTLAAIRSVPDPQKKITLITGCWPTKDEMREAYCRHLNPGDWMLVMDGDEVLFDDAKWRLLYWARTHRAVNFPMLTFWNDFDTLATGVWNDFRPVKFVRWEHGMRYADHLNFVDASGRRIGYADDGRTTVSDIPLAAHYAYVKPLAKIKGKLDYYIRMTGRIREDYFENVFLRYRIDPAAALRHGTHPFGGGGAKRFTSTHPAPIRTRLDHGTLGGLSW